MATVKMTISLPQTVFDRMEQYRRKAKLSRSEALARAADQFLCTEEERESMKRIDQVHSDPQVRREQKDFARMSRKAFMKLVENTPW